MVSTGPSGPVARFDPENPLDAYNPGHLPRTRLSRQRARRQRRPGDLYWRLSATTCRGRRGAGSRRQPRMSSDGSPARAIATSRCVTSICTPTTATTRISAIWAATMTARLSVSEARRLGLSTAISSNRRRHVRPARRLPARTGRLVELAAKCSRPVRARIVTSRTPVTAASRCFPETGVCTAL